MAKQSTNVTGKTQYKPVRLEHDKVDFVNKFIIGMDLSISDLEEREKGNFTDKFKGIVRSYEMLLTLTRKELSVTFSKEEFMYLISIMDTSSVKDIINDLAVTNNYKSMLISFIQESLSLSSIETNFNVDGRELLVKVQKLPLFSAFTLIYSSLEYIVNYSSNDVDNIYLSNYFSPV